MSRLLQRGANPNSKDKFNAAPLRYAVQPERQFDGIEASPIMVDMAKLLMNMVGYVACKCNFERVLR
jgi:hypothetical protein